MRRSARALVFVALLALAAAVCLLAGASTTHRNPSNPPPRASLAGSGAAAAVASKGSETAVPAPPSAPISMTDADGQELIVEELSARAAIQGMLSLTELELRFRNPKAKRVEGRFTCTLPRNAAISRFAKEVNGQLMEGEVVERLVANQVYDQFLHQMRDPALLEQDQGNRFSARIFPIEANASVRIVLSYSTLLPIEDGVRRYSLPLRGMAKVNHLTFRAFVAALPGEEGPGSSKSNVSGLEHATHSTADVVSFEEHDSAPQRDVELTWRPSTDTAPRLLRAGDFYLASFRPRVATAAVEPPHAWSFYVDTSASSAEGSEHRIRALELLLGALPPGDSVQLVAFDQEIVPLASGTAAFVARELGALLRGRLFLGGTDLGAVMKHIANAAQRDRSRAFVVASDLVATLGNAERKDVVSAIAAIPVGTTVDALILGSRQEAAVAKVLTAGRGRIVTIPFTESLDERARDAAASLRRPRGGTFDVADATAEWVYPQHFDDVQPGDEILVLGHMKPASEPAPHLVGGAADNATPVALAAATFGPLLQREGYRAYLDYLAEREATEPAQAVRSALATEQVKVSVEQRVVIPRTTMLVLESEWDYQRFRLDRRALADILTIDGGGIGVLNRSHGQVVYSPAPPPKPAPPPIVRMEGARADARPTPPPPPPPPASSSVEGGVEGGVMGGVVGGVVGGVAGGAPGGAPAGVAANAPSEIAGWMYQQTAPQEAPPAELGRAGAAAAPPPADAITEVQTTVNDAAVPPERHLTGQVSINGPAAGGNHRREAKREDVDWTHPHRATREEVDALQAKLAGDPRDRETYNLLSDALAARGEWDALRKLAIRWQPYDPENPQVYEVLGAADEALGNASEAARADASLIELAPAKPELLQRAGLLLLRTHRASLAETPLRRALELRPDRVNSYRHLALMLWREGRLDEAARVLESATHQQFPQWYGNAQRVVREELGYVYRAMLAKDAARGAEVRDRAREYDVDLTRRDALRVTLAWETDANDVDLHVVDPAGEECFYSHKQTAEGLELYEDITQGFGPEVVRTSKLHDGTYHIGVNYFAAGPMGVSRGIVVVLRGDDVDIHPFRLVNDSHGADVRYIAAVKVKT